MKASKRRCIEKSRLNDLSAPRLSEGDCPLQTSRQKSKWVWKRLFCRVNSMLRSSGRSRMSHTLSNRSVISLSRRATSNERTLVSNNRHVALRARFNGVSSENSSYRTNSLSRWTALRRTCWLINSRPRTTRRFSSCSTYARSMPSRSASRRLSAKYENEGVYERHRLSAQASERPLSSFQRTADMQHVQ